jgi:hypothetical protein
MDSDDHKAVVFNVKPLTAESRATGPRTEKGKLRSALNAVKHGLGGHGLLLPGEDPVEYEARMDAVFTSMTPRDEAEAQLVALVGDDLWKLGRLARIEKAITLARVEELLATTGSGEHAAILTSAIQQLGRALAGWSVEPVPTTRSADYYNRYKAFVDAVLYVENTVQGIPVVLVGACHDALDQVRGKKDDVEVSTASYMKVFEVCRMLMSSLLDAGQRQDAEQDQLRAAIAGIALPDEAELKKLARYRAMLELSLQRRLAAAP